MTTSRKTVAVIVMVFTIGLLSGCNKQDKTAEEKTTAQKTETREQAGTEQEPEGLEEEGAELETGAYEGETPVATAKEAVSGGKIPDVKNAVSAQYVGAKKCKACHIKQYKSWEKTKMATSFENLKPGVKVEAKKLGGLDPDKDYTADPECLKCHTTGYGKPSGFINLAETPDLINVQCEACHGPGSEYVLIMRKNKKFKLYEVKAVGYVFPKESSAEKECRVCHNDESPFNEKVDFKYKFVFKERLKKTHEHLPLKYEH